MQKELVNGGCLAECSNDIKNNQARDQGHFDFHFSQP